MIYLAMPDKADQRRIFLALTRKYDLHPDFDVDAVLDQCTTTFTGADLYALCSDAMLNAVRPVGAPRGPLHWGCSARAAPRGVADLFYTDVRSILMVL